MESLKQQIKIFHTGDFHLDSPFAGYNVKQSDIRRSELRDTFCSSLSRAKTDNCDIVLIAGDLFDSGYISSETLNRVFSAIEKCALPIVIAPGNHDPYKENGIYSRKDLPKNLYVFNKSEMQSFSFDNIGLCVHGYAFTSDRLDYSPINDGCILNNEYINVLCAHGDLESSISKYAPINPIAIETSLLDYAALGHIHKISNPRILGLTTVAYCGFPEGRAFDELGIGGALEITLDRNIKGKAKVERIPLTNKQYMIESIDVTGAASIADILPAITTLIKDSSYGEETSLRIIINGMVSPNMPEDITLNPEDFGVALLDIVNDTMPIYDSEYLKNDLSLRGALYRELLPELQSGDKQRQKIASEALKIGIYALEGKQFM